MLKPERIGILGGSFDPIHHGHLILAERAAEILMLDRLLFIPTAVTPHKRRRKMAPAADRLEMVRHAVRGHPAFEASDMEIRRSGVSYTIDTVREVRRRAAGARPFLLMGSDSLPLLHKWKDIRGIAREASLVVFRRPNREGAGMSIEGVRVRLLGAPLVGISSTEIRRRMGQGLSIRYLVPEAVRQYIVRRRLYRT